MPDGGGLKDERPVLKVQGYFFFFSRFDTPNENLN
jgi:hypothetical protein